MSTVNQLFPDVNLARGDVTLTYSGVRPLPYAAAGSESSISRDHSLEASEWHGIPVLTLVGGKLTTSRAFGELVTDEVLRRLWIARSATTVARWVPGGKNVPADHAALVQRWNEVAAHPARRSSRSAECRRCAGTCVTEILESERSAGPDATRWQNLSGTSLPWAFALGD